MHCQCGQVHGTWNCPVSCAAADDPAQQPDNERPTMHTVNAALACHASSSTATSMHAAKQHLHTGSHLWRRPCMHPGLHVCSDAKSDMQEKMACMKPPGGPTCFLGDARDHVCIRQDHCHRIHENDLVDMSILVSPIEVGEGALRAHEIPHMTCTQLQPQVQPSGSQPTGSGCQSWKLCMTADNR